MKKPTFFLAAVLAIFCILFLAQTTNSFQGDVSTARSNKTLRANQLPNTNNAAIIAHANFIASYMPAIICNHSNKSLLKIISIASIVNINNPLITNTELR